MANHTLSGATVAPTTTTPTRTQTHTHHTSIHPSMRRHKPTCSTQMYAPRVRGGAAAAGGGRTVILRAHPDSAIPPPQMARCCCYARAHRRRYTREHLPAPARSTARSAADACTDANPSLTAPPHSVPGSTHLERVREQAVIPSGIAEVDGKIAVALHRTCTQKYMNCGRRTHRQARTACVSTCARVPAVRASGAHRGTRR